MNNKLSCSRPILIFLLILAVRPVLAGAYPGAGQPGAFLKVGMDARAAAMGSAYTAVCRDAAAAYWNPAGLALVKRQEFMATYTVFPGNGEYTQLAYALPLNAWGFPVDNKSGSEGAGPEGTIGITIRRMATTYDIEARSTDSLNPDYLFSNVEGAYSLAFGMPIGRNINLGLGAKGLYHQLDQEDAAGWGIDAGIAWNGFPGLTAALAVRDVYTCLEWSTGLKEQFPVVFKLGAAYRMTVREIHGLLFSADLEQSTSSRAARPRAGLEYAWADIIFLRGGYDDGQISTGGGVRVPWIGWAQAALRLDYAAEQDRIDGWDHWITVKIEF